VAISDDGATLAVGSPFDDGDEQSTFENPTTNAPSAGAAYIFATTNRTTWPLQAYLKAPNAAENDRLGSAVALSADGNEVAIGAPGEDGDTTSTLNDDNDNLSDAGAVYVFTRTESLWSPAPAYLKPSTSFELANFGGSLSMTDDANVLAVGPPSDRTVTPEKAAAFVYVRVGNAWLEQTKLADTGPSEEFSTVLLTADGSTLFVGAENSAAPIGTVHVY
jgi:hypothetical protein